MSILFLGNCQVNAMRGITRDMFPAMPVQFRTITPFWGKFDKEATIEEIESSQLLVAQSIENPSADFNRLELLEVAGGDVVFVPYVYIDGLASLEIIASKGKTVLKGAQQLLEGQEGKKPIKVFEDYCYGRIDMHNEQRIEASVSKLELKEKACDLEISDYIRDTIFDQPTLFGINHPTQFIVFELYRRLCAYLGWSYDPDVAKDEVVWGKRALPSAQRSFSPYDAKRLNTKYPCDPQWYGQANTIFRLALKAREKGEI